MPFLDLLGFGPEGWGDELLSGLFVTLALALATLPFGLALGFVIALGKQAEDGYLRLAANIYTTIFRGLPELLTLFLVYFGAQIAVQKLTGMVTPGVNFEINSFVAGMIALGVVFSSYASEVFLSAFRAIPRGQYEGGYAIGLTPWLTMRLVILPQLFRISFPGLANLWLVLIKDTALVSVIGLSDILRHAQIASRVSKEPLLFFSVACLLYLALTMLSSIGFAAIERRSGRGRPAR